MDDEIVHARNRIGVFKIGDTASSDIPHSEYLRDHDIRASGGTTAMRRAGCA